MHVIYLHGFCSSSQSFKAQLVKDYVEQSSDCSLCLYDLPHEPQKAMSKVEDHIRTLGNEPWGVVGSSLGGYYATYLAEKYAVNAVLINPAVRAYSLLAPLLGENKNYHSETSFELTQAHLDQLQSIYVNKIESPERYLLLTQTGDEVLDYQEGVDYYKGAHQVVISGGNHGFDDYTDYLEHTFNHLKG